MSHKLNLLKKPNPENVFRNHLTSGSVVAQTPDLQYLLCANVRIFAGVVIRKYCGAHVSNETDLRDCYG